MSVTNMSIPELIRSTAKSYFDNHMSETTNGEINECNDHYLDALFKNKNVLREISALDEYLQYYHTDAQANYRKIDMVLRLGMRLGAWYHIIENSFEHVDYSYDD